MRPLGVLLLLLICQFVTSIPIFDRDEPSLQRKVRAAGLGETLQNWYKTIKDRIIKRWKDWFGTDSSTPNFSAHDILNIDKTIENRIPGYPGFFVDLSNVSFDPKQDWGVRLGKWYIIRKITGDTSNSDSDSDDWDIIPIAPKLSPPTMFGVDWTPNWHGLGIPEITQRPSTTPKIEMTTYQQTTPEVVTQIESFSTSSKPTVTFTESIRPTTALTTSAESNGTTTQTSTFVESVVTSTETIVIPTEETTTPFTKPISSSIEPAVSSTEKVTISAETNKPTVISAESSTPSIESIITSTKTISTEAAVTSTELVLPVLNKRIEDNETHDTHTKKPNHASSAEVIMF